MPENDRPAPGRAAGPDDVAEFFARAVAAWREATTPHDHDAVRELLHRAAGSGPAAVRLAITQATSADPVVRAVACDLLGIAGNDHEDVRAAAATALTALAGTEVDDDVQWSIARALGSTADARALPVLAELARHGDADVRLQVASLPGVLDDPPDGLGVATLIDLSADPDPQVRNWATFGLGWQSTADGPAVRQALWQRTGDSDAEAREEGIRGLARRRDPGALPLLTELLAEDSAHVFTFDAAAVLADPALLPVLEKFDPADPGVAEAIRACDPVLRAHRDAAAARLVEAVHAELPDLGVAIRAEPFEPGLHLELTDRPDGRRWFVEALLARAGGDPDHAARLVAEDLRAAGHPDGSPG